MATAFQTDSDTPEPVAARTHAETMVVRFAGDSGDGMQLTGGQFTLSTALAGEDFSTFPDFPAEIRAPQGTTFGVSAFQINFGANGVETAGDEPDVLVAMNPAALKTNVVDLRPGGLVIIDSGEFTARNLAKAGYTANPLEDGSLARWQVMAFDISRQTLEAVKPFGLGNKEALRCKNMWTLGLALWMFDRDRAPLIDWLKSKFSKNPVLAQANAAALKTNVVDLSPGGLVIIDSGEFTARNLAKAGYAANPLEDGSLAKWQVLAFDISRQTLQAVKPFGLGNKEALRCKNMWTLGLALWMFDREREPLIEWLKSKFSKNPVLATANAAALNAGHAYGETAELGGPLRQYDIDAAATTPGFYRTVTGGESLALGLVAGAKLANLPMFFGSYPITPASPILHALARLKEFGVTTFQAEDEIAAIASAIGASYAGQLGVTSSSGPGIALKGEAMGLAIITELPLVIVNSQRGGPSTGLPTKTEQSDLYQAVYGRNGDAPMVVLASRSPSDCFEVAIEACRLATQFMTPVLLLTDGYIANAAEPWRVPDMDGFAPFPVVFHTEVPAEGRINPYQRDPATLKRIWIKPGTPGLTHRIGGIEKAVNTGHINYDADNHQAMTDIRRDKILQIARHIPAQAVDQGGTTGKLAVVGWGSTYGPISKGVQRARARGLDVSHIHIRHIWPLPANLGELLHGYDRIIVPEMNTGQLKTVLRDQYLVDARPLNKVSGHPFKISEIEAAIDAALATTGIVR